MTSAGKSAAARTHVPQLPALSPVPPPGTTHEPDEGDGPGLADILGIPGFQPLHLDPDAKPAPVIRVTLITIGDQSITVPAEVPQTVAVEYMHRAGLHDGTEERASMAMAAATDYLLTEVLGADGYARMRSYEALTSDQFQWVMKVVIRLALGRLETPKA